jgi:2-methylcitrate synthase
LIITQKIKIINITIITMASGGLAGIIVGDSAVATVGLAGKGLNYRGYSIEELSEHSTFEDVAFLLLKGHLPNAHEYQ